jgi:hypothetical protein
MVTLERIDAGSVLVNRRAPGPATSPTEEASIAQRIRTGSASLFWSMRLLPPPRGRSSWRCSPIGVTRSRYFMPVGHSTW